MKMAKLQKATLDPSKVSGRCGRLRCCLAYEHRGYEELSGKLPRVGLYVQTPQGPGRVRERQVLTQLVQVILENNRIVAFGLEEITPMAAPPAGARREGDRPPRDSRDGRDTRDGRDDRRERHGDADVESDDDTPIDLALPGDDADTAPMRIEPRDLNGADSEEVATDRAEDTADRDDDRSGDVSERTASRDDRPARPEGPGDRNDGDRRRRRRGRRSRRRPGDRPNGNDSRPPRENDGPRNDAPSA